MLVPEGERLPMLNSLRIPDGADDLKVRRVLLNEFGVEVGGALEATLKTMGIKVNPGAIEAAASVCE